MKATPEDVAKLLLSLSPLWLPTQRLNEGHARRRGEVADLVTMAPGD